MNMNWYPATVAEVDALPLASDGAELFTPIMGVNQITRLDSEDGRTVTLVGRYAGEWVRREFSASATLEDT